MNLFKIQTNKIIQILEHQKTNKKKHMNQIILIKNYQYLNTNQFQNQNLLNMIIRINRIIQ